MLAVSVVGSLSVIAAEEARLGAPPWSYRVGLVAGLPGLLMLPLVLWMHWVRVTDGLLASSRPRWVVGIVYLASIVWVKRTGFVGDRIR